MRFRNTWRLRLGMIAICAVAALPCFADEVAVLRNGFSIRHERREVVGDITRLYVNGDESSYVDVPTAEIEHFEAAPAGTLAPGLQKPAAPPSAKSVRPSQPGRTSQPDRKWEPHGFAPKNLVKSPALNQPGQTTTRGASCSLPQAPNLLYMVQAVHQVKLLPLRSRERAQDRMIQKFAARPKLFFTARNHVVHFGNLGPNPGQHCFRRQSARTRHRRGFPAGRKISQPHHHQCPPALLPGWLRGGRWLPSSGHALQSLDGSSVGQVQMLQHFAGAPLSLRVRAELFGRESCDRRRNLTLQSLETRVHAGYLPFPLFRLEYCATLKLTHVITGRMS